MPSTYLSAWSGRSIILPLGRCSFCASGAVDDWRDCEAEEKARNAGQDKIPDPGDFAFLAAFALKYHPGRAGHVRTWCKRYIKLDGFYIPIAMFIIVMCSNAVNLSDGLDGLAGLITATAFAAYGGIALIQQQVFWPFLFHYCWRHFWFLMVQCPPALLFMGTLAHFHWEPRWVVWH